MIKDNSYIVIPGWVINKYQLKGNALMVYSIIYGFCQDRGSCFHGSLQYLQDWTCSTRQGIIKVLKELIEKKLIRKEENFPNNNYYIIFDDEIQGDSQKNTSEQSLPNSKQSLQGCKQSLPNSKQSLHNNINNNIDNNINNNIDNICSDEHINIININTDNKNFNKKENIYIEKNLDKNTNINKQKNIKHNTDFNSEIELLNITENIISYLNSICHTNYKSSTNATRKYIKARLKEGFSIDDFKIVIDYMYAEWGIKPVKFSNGQTSDNYLRPSTLFGPKMEEYLQAALKSCNKSKYEIKSEKVDRSKLSDLVF